MSAGFEWWRCRSRCRSWRSRRRSRCRHRAGRHGTQRLNAQLQVFGAVQCLAAGRNPVRAGDLRPPVIGCPGYTPYACTMHRGPLLDGVPVPPLDCAQSIPSGSLASSPTVPGGYVLPVLRHSRTVGLCLALESPDAAPGVACRWCRHIATGGGAAAVDAGARAGDAASLGCGDAGGDAAGACWTGSVVARRAGREGRWPLLPGCWLAVLRPRRETADADAAAGRARLMPGLPYLILRQQDELVVLVHDEDSDLGRAGRRPGRHGRPQRPSLAGPRPTRRWRAGLPRGGPAQGPRALARALEAGRAVVSYGEDRTEKWLTSDSADLRPGGAGAWRRHRLRRGARRRPGHLGQGLAGTRPVRPSGPPGRCTSHPEHAALPDTQVRAGQRALARPRPKCAGRGLARAAGDRRGPRCRAPARPGLGFPAFGATPPGLGSPRRSRRGAPAARGALGRGSPVPRREEGQMTAPGGPRPFVPGDFAVPRELATGEFRLELARAAAQRRRPGGSLDVEQSRTSARHQGLEGLSWPDPAMTAEENPAPAAASPRTSPRGPGSPTRSWPGYPTGSWAASTSTRRTAPRVWPTCAPGSGPTGPGLTCRSTPRPRRLADAWPFAEVRYCAGQPAAWRGRGCGSLADARTGRPAANCWPPPRRSTPRPPPPPRSACLGGIAVPARALGPHGAAGPGIPRLRRGGAVPAAGRRCAGSLATRAMPRTRTSTRRTGAQRMILAAPRMGFVVDGGVGTFQMGHRSRSRPGSLLTSGALQHPPGRPAADQAADRADRGEGPARRRWRCWLDLPDGDPGGHRGRLLGAAGAGDQFPPP